MGNEEEGGVSERPSERAIEGEGRDTREGPNCFVTRRRQNIRRNPIKCVLAPLQKSQTCQTDLDLIKSSKEA